MAPDIAALGVIANLVSMHTLLTLRRKNIISHQETTEIIEQVILNLETHEALAEGSERAIWQAGRAQLELLRQQFVDRTQLPPQT